MSTMACRAEGMSVSSSAPLVRWRAPDGRVSGAIIGTPEAKRQAVMAAMRTPGRPADATLEDNIAALWTSLHRAGWRIEDDPR